MSKEDEIVQLSSELGGDGVLVTYYQGKPGRRQRHWVATSTVKPRRHPGRWVRASGDTHGMALMNLRDLMLKIKEDR